MENFGQMKKSNIEIWFETMLAFAGILVAAFIIIPGSFILAFFSIVCFPLYAIFRMLKYAAKLLTPH